MENNIKSYIKRLKSSLLTLIVSIVSNIVVLLGIVFVILKLLNIIDWSWWIVTCPFVIIYIPASIGITILFIVLLKQVFVLFKEIGDR